MQYITKTELADRWKIAPAALDMRCWRARKAGNSAHPQVVDYGADERGHRVALFDLEQVEAWETLFATINGRGLILGAA